MSETQREYDQNRICRRLSGGGSFTLTQIAKPMQPRPFQYCRELLAELVRQGKVIEFNKPMGVVSRPCKLYQLN